MRLRREPEFLLFEKDIHRYDWRSVRLFLYIYFGAFVLAGVFGPVLYAFIQNLGNPANADSLLAYLQAKPLSRYIDRVRLLGAAAGVIWLIGTCGLWGRFGFHWRDKGPSTLLRYFVFGVLTLGFIAMAQVYFLGQSVRFGTIGLPLLEILGGALVSGLLIGWLEEAIFRGMVLRMFYTATKPLPAVLLSSFVFAAVHFKDVPYTGSAMPDWSSGLIIAGYQSVSFLLYFEALEFAILFFAGVVLSLVFLRTGSLLACMGLHAGWVFVRNTWGELTHISPGSATQIWGSAGIVDGYASLILLTGISIGLYANLVKNGSDPAVAVVDRT